MRDIEFIEGSQVAIAYERHGSPDGWPVVLTHGFPYDPRCYDEVAAELVSDGAHVVLPYMRGYGPTRYRSASIIRSGQQAALASDLRDLIVGLRLERPIVGGFDWGGRASCVASLLWPEMIGGLVTVGGYNVHDISTMATTPSTPDDENRNWYQWYFHSERGRRGLDLYRTELTRQLWREWSPTWAAPDGAFERTRPSFDNPDFVATVVHSYRHRYGLAMGDPVHDAREACIARQPPITVPTVVIDATADPLEAPLPERVHRGALPRSGGIPARRRRTRRPAGSAQGVRHRRPGTPRACNGLGIRSHPRLRCAGLDGIRMPAPHPSAPFSRIGTRAPVGTASLGWLHARR